MEKKWCNTCRYEDEFIRAEELGIDEPYLCTKDADGTTGLGGCITVTKASRDLLSKVGCASHQERDS